jgi:hypothetical protein
MQNKETFGGIKKKSSRVIMHHPLRIFQVITLTLEMS